MSVSDHLPVVAELKNKKSSVNVENRTIDIKPKWDKCDHRKYKDIISRNIGQFPDDGRTEFEFLCALGHMTSELKRVVVVSVPGYRDKTNVKTAKHRIWNEKIESAVKDQNTYGGSGKNAFRQKTWIIHCMYREEMQGKI